MARDTVVPTLSGLEWAILEKLLEVRSTPFGLCGRLRLDGWRLLELRMGRALRRLEQAGLVLDVEDPGSYTAGRLRCYWREITPAGRDALHSRSKVVGSGSDPRAQDPGEEA